MITSNKAQSDCSSFKVYVRIRPLNHEEKEEKNSKQIPFLKASGNVVNLNQLSIKRSNEICEYVV